MPRKAPYLGGVKAFRKIIPFQSVSSGWKPDEPVKPLTKEHVVRRREIMRGTRFASGFLFLSVLISIMSSMNALGQETDGGADDLGALNIICCLLNGVILIVWVMVALWAKNDAQRRGIDNPALWGIVVFLAGIVGLIIYLLVIRPKGTEPKVEEEGPKSGTCPHCGYDAGTTAGRCPNCGSNLS
jgi:hypothetical protein